MAVIFDRPGFRTGVVVLEWDDAQGNPVSQAFTPLDKGQSFDLPEEARAKAKFDRFLPSQAEHAQRRSQRADDRANKRARRF